MPLDPDRALAATAPPVTSQWDCDRVLLYHLGVGAGSPAADERELRFVYERRLVVLPTFAMVLAADASTPAITGPGLDYDPLALLHGEQQLEVFQAIPVAGHAVSTARIEAVWDKGSAAVFVVRVDTTLADGSALCRNRLALFVRGAGGFGGAPGPRLLAREPPSEAAWEVEVPTIAQLAAVFRLTGDRTALHIDPSAAAAAGLPRPTVPGLCTWGIACKALVDRCADGDVTAVREFSARFAGPLFPGETVVLRCWPEDGGFAFDGHVKERGTPLLARGVLRID